MNSARRFVLVLLMLLTTSQRLPAPISEVEEKATTAPEESAKPKVKHSSKPKSNDEDNEVSDKSRARKSEQSPSSTPRPSGKAKNLTGPSPQVPAEAVKQHLTGKGTYLLHFDQTSGTVTDVTVVQSAGSPLLDEAAITAFRQWHEDPNCAKEVTMTISFAAAAAPQ